MDRIFTDDEVASLEGYQKCGFLHPFTCCGQPQKPTPQGMLCEVCGVVQDWAHRFMLDWSWRKMDPWKGTKLEAGGTTDGEGAA